MNFGFNLRNWTFGISWDIEAVTICFGPVGLSIWREAGRW